MENAMKIEAKHLVGAALVITLTGLFRDELTKELRRHAWL